MIYVFDKESISSQKSNMPYLSTIKSKYRGNRDSKTKHPNFAVISIILSLLTLALNLH